jgi:hypothetical protein
MELSPNYMVKPSMQPTSRRLWLSPRQFSSWKGPDGHSRASSFSHAETHKVDIATSVQESLVEKGIKATSHPLFSLSESEVRTCWLLAFQGQLQKELGRGHSQIKLSLFSLI